METLKTPEFIYFDLGKVLLDFSHEVMCAQMASQVGLDSDRVHEIVFGGGLCQQYESGLIDSQQFCQAFFEKSGTQCEIPDLLLAGSNIFSLNTEMVALVAQLATSGIGLGVLSNTCEAHWQFLKERFRFLTEFFSTMILSFEVGALKPDARIYEQAAKQINVKPESIFFVDDRKDNIAGAVDAGWDAHVFQSAEQTLVLLLERGIRFNY